MLKKLTLLATSVGALLALAAPAAQAEGPLVTNAVGEKSTYVTAVSSNTITHTAAGTFECTTAILTIHLTENANTTVKGHGTGTMTGTPNGVGHAAKHTGHCGSSAGSVTEYTSVTISDLHLTKHGGETTGTATLSLTYDLRSATGAGLIAECTFGTPEKKVVVKKTGADTINLSGEIKKTTGGPFCPSTGTITGDFTITDDAIGSPVTIH